MNHNLENFQTRPIDPQAASISRPPENRRARRWPRWGHADGKTRRGASVIEFAIVAPIFLLMVIGMIELGRALMVQQVIINASRVGARQAIVPGSNQGDVQTAVEAYAASVAVPGVVVNVSPSPSGASPGDPITVTASVDFSNVSWLASPWFLGGATLNASSEMRKEGFE